MFAVVGYFEEFFVKGKYVGTKKCNEQDRAFGYKGRKAMKATEAILLDNKKRIVAGEEYVSQYYPINGRMNSTAIPES